MKEKDIGSFLVCQAFPFNTLHLLTPRNRSEGREIDDVWMDLLMNAAYIISFTDIFIMVALLYNSGRNPE